MLLWVALGLAGCSDPNTGAVVFEKIDDSQVPNTAIAADHPQLKRDNGVYLFGGRPYSGLIEERYPTGILKSVVSYRNGKLYGTSRTFYRDGNRFEIRQYKENLAYGRHLGFWPNGQRKFDFTYYNDQLEGVQRQWYQDGKPYTCQTYRCDSEDGMQKAWRANGKLFANYEVREGICYGLQKTNLCYTLRDEKIK